MLDFFAVITKGGLVLWYFQDAVQQLDTSIAAINTLIRNVILQERGGIDMYTQGNHALKCRMDNQFDLLFVVVYQKILQLGYVDKFLSDIQLEFRDKFKNELDQGLYYQTFSFNCEFDRILCQAEVESKLLKPQRRPRTFEESSKSKKTVDSMIEKRAGEPAKKSTKKKQDKGSVVEEIEEPDISPSFEEHQQQFDEQDDDDGTEKSEETSVADELDESTIRKNMDRLSGMKRTSKFSKTKSPKVRENGKKGKQCTVWDMGGKDTKSLDYSTPSSSDVIPLNATFLPDPSQVGTLRGNVPNMVDTTIVEKEKKSSGGMFSLFRGLVGGKSLTETDIAPILIKLKDHLIAKNVASEISENLCQSVSSKLQGKHLGTFEGVASTVKATMVDALIQLLTPKRRIDILRDVQEAKSNGRPYAITFCGVNGVGKSTNLAKITFWLIENNMRVLIAACDTFRAGAVEQLRTHVHHLNALHPASIHNGRQMVELFEQGYGKDAADIARHALDYARKNIFDAVLIDTAGRMQDNEPLMRALAKLIHVNEPDLTLFVGEALVGNEAVDQLVKFNRALSNQSSMNSTRNQVIDGIVLTKFDTIDDQVGAAVSMTYITGQPIIFVGTGQTYTDLRNLDAQAVVNALMK